MNDIDFIKWMIGYAEGFACKGHYKGTLYYMAVAFCSFNATRITGDALLYPLLLQRAIEGINKKGTYEILQRFKGIGVFVDTLIYKAFLFSGYESIDQAKEAALKYIYKQENGK